MFEEFLEGFWPVFDGGGVGGCCTMDGNRHSFSTGFGESDIVSSYDNNGDGESPSFVLYW